MDPSAVERKLAAILSADIEGYSRLVVEDEPGTLAAVKAHMLAVEPLVTAHHGRIFKTLGDGFLAEFASVLDAVDCAVGIQRLMRVRNAEADRAQRLSFRIGVNLGDVIIDQGDVFGDGVNLAVRLQSLADAGGICISRTVRDQVRDRRPYEFDDLGPRDVKNVPRPVHAFAVRFDGEQTPASAKRAARRRFFVGAGAAMAAVAIFLAFGYWRTAQDEHEAPPVAPVLATRSAVESPAVSVPEAAIAPAPTAPIPTLPPSSPGQIALAVLPFASMSEDTRQAYLADGLAEDLITDLTKIGGLSIVARNVVQTYRGRTVSPVQVGQELGVQYVVEGSVRVAGERVRITAELVDTITGRQLWSERYDRAFSEMFELQDDVRASILAALAVRLSAVESEKLTERPAEPRILSQTAETITLLRTGRAQAVYDAAIAYCRREGKVAALVSRSEASDIYEFRCEASN